MNHQFELGRAFASSLAIVAAAAGLLAATLSLGCIGEPFVRDEGVEGPMASPAGTLQAIPLKDPESDGQDASDGKGEVGADAVDEGAAAEQTYDGAADAGDEVGDASNDEGAGEPIEFGWIAVAGGMIQNPATGAAAVVEPYQVANLEVTLAQAESCFFAGHCGSLAYSGDACAWRQGEANEPVVCIDKYAAEALCAWLGARLPTELELAMAASALPVTPEAACWRKADGRCAVGSWPSDSVSGVYDLRGGVAEWTSSSFDWQPDRAVFGGAWPDAIQINRRPASPLVKSASVGVRCARDGGAS